MKKIPSNEFGPLASAILKQKYLMPGETWEQLAQRVSTSVFAAVSLSANDELVQRISGYIRDRKFLPGGRYLYAAGREWHQTQNCLLLRAEDSSEGWADLMHKATAALMSGAGIGVDYSALREQGAEIKRKGGQSTGPIALMKMVNEAGRHIMQGGSRRSAIWAGLNWDHQDIWQFIESKNWSNDIRMAKSRDFNFPAPLDGTNISVILDKRFFDAYEAGDSWARGVYNKTLHQMVTTAEPGFSIDYANKNESLRNACCELTSEDDSDICNIGSLNFSRIETLEELQEITQAATAFLLAGTVYSHVPYAKVANVREKNRRLGLGIMGLHEWLIQRGKPYGPDAELAQWLEDYEDCSDVTSIAYSVKWSLSEPIKVRAIAPNGSIGIIGETTSGIEPLFCVAYKRRYLKNGSQWHYQNVVDPVARRLVESGIDATKIEDAYILSKDVMRRVKFQAWVQQYVDHGISSTVNLPAWNTEFNNAETLSKLSTDLFSILPKLRGITMYPDGCRDGQPITPIPYEEAARTQGTEFIEEYGDVCDLKSGGSCGS